MSRSRRTTRFRRRVPTPIRHAFGVAIGLVIACAPLRAQTARGENGMIVARSDTSFEATLARVEPAVTARGLSVMHVVDHATAANRIGIPLEPLTVVLFGNPQVGSQLMACAPRVGIDLPQKLLVWQEGDAVFVAYNDPAYLVRRHGITGCAEILGKVANTLRDLLRSVSGTTTPAPPTPRAGG